MPDKRLTYPQLSALCYLAGVTLSPTRPIAPETWSALQRRGLVEPHPVRSLSEIPWRLTPAAQEVLGGQALPGSPSQSGANELGPGPPMSSPFPVRIS